MSAETEILVRYLDQQRQSVLAIVGGLAEAALRRAVFPSGWTCLSLIHHLAIDDERYWFRGVAAAESIEFPTGEESGWLAGPMPSSPPRPWIRWAAAAIRAPGSAEGLPAVALPDLAGAWARWFCG